jgi:hypothetical protein
MARTEVEAKLRSACGGMKNMIKRLEALIKIGKRNLDRLRADLKKLESKPKPDAAQINALKRSISAAVERLRKDGEALSELKDVFRENCGPF